MFIFAGMTSLYFIVIVALTIIQYVLDAAYIKKAGHRSLLCALLLMFWQCCSNGVALQALNAFGII